MKNSPTLDRRLGFRTFRLSDLDLNVDLGPFGGAVSGRLE